MSLPLPIVLIFIWVIVAVLNLIEVELSETNRVHIANYFICWIALIVEFLKDL